MEGSYILYILIQCLYSAHKSHCFAQNKIHYRLKVSVHTALNLLGVKALLFFFVFVLQYNCNLSAQVDYYHLQMSPHPFNPGSVVLRSDKMGQFLTIYRKALLSSTLPSDLRFTHNAHAKTTREKLLKREMDTPSKQISSVFSDIQLRCKGWINMLIDGRRFMIALSEKKGKRSLYFKVNGKTVKCQ